MKKCLMKLLNIYGTELEVTNELKDDLFFKQKCSFTLILFIKNGDVKQDFIAKAIVIFFLIR